MQLSKRYLALVQALLVRWESRGTKRFQAHVRRGTGHPELTCSETMCTIMFLFGRTASGLQAGSRSVTIGGLKGSQVHNTLTVFTTQLNTCEHNSASDVHVSCGCEAQELESPNVEVQAQSCHQGPQKLTHEGKCFVP